MITSKCAICRKNLTKNDTVKIKKGARLITACSAHAEKIRESTQASHVNTKKY
jgi:hypothetical protein